MNLHMKKNNIGIYTKSYNHFILLRCMVCVFNKALLQIFFIFVSVSLSEFKTASAITPIYVRQFDVLICARH